MWLLRLKVVYIVMVVAVVLQCAPGGLLHMHCSRLPSWPRLVRPSPAALQRCIDLPGHNRHQPGRLFPVHAGQHTGSNSGSGDGDPQQPWRQDPSQQPQQQKQKQRPGLLQSLFAKIVLLLRVLGTAALLVAALPYLLSSRLGTSVAAAAASRMLPGDVKIQRISLGWTQPLAVHGLSIFEAAAGSSRQLVGLQRFSSAGARSLCWGFEWSSCRSASSVAAILQQSVHAYMCACQHPQPSAYYNTSTCIACVILQHCSCPCVLLLPATAEPLHQVVTGKASHLTLTLTNPSIDCSLTDAGDNFRIVRYLEQSSLLGILLGKHSTAASSAAAAAASAAQQHSSKATSAAADIHSHPIQVPDTATADDDADGTASSAASNKGGASAAAPKAAMQAASAASTLSAAAAGGSTSSSSSSSAISPAQPASALPANFLQRLATADASSQVSAELRLPYVSVYIPDGQLLLPQEMA